MTKLIIYIASTAVMILMALCGQKGSKKESPETIVEQSELRFNTIEIDEFVMYPKGEEDNKVNILSWPRMAVNDFGCMMEHTFGHRDERFNCDLQSYKNKGTPCYNTDEYYEGPLFPQHIVKKIHPRLEKIVLSWEGGRLQNLWLIFDQEFTEAEILNAFEIIPDKLPNNIYDLNLNGYHISLSGFDHFGAGEADCDEGI